MADEIKTKIKQLGYRMTPQRQAIINRVTCPGPSLTAAEIWERVRGDFPDISLDTVYRNLNVLVDIGVLTPIAGAGKDGTRYELSHSNHHHHIVCLKCGNAACIDLCLIDSQFLKTVGDLGYELVRHNIELFGVCEKCRNSREKTCTE
jgi:Fe2+ or Zn2+ uptake regulation protein